VENPNDHEEYQGMLEEERERICEKGKVVFRYDALSDSPAGNGYCTIYRLGGKYAVESDSDLLDRGPFASLREALEKSGASEIGPAVGEIECTGIKVAELLGLLTFYGEPRTVLINGRPQRVQGGS
jgi:hypothetical protein